ncbi:MAG: pimelyl-ACP methyl ester esterase BioV [Campylobacteraceae bacterium]|nr:pimelyl-ACP methyl ester esterase BioV [Campylobacteraceae bacterium]
MRYFSGFCLKGEEELFSAYLNQSDFCVAGFSLGAIQAFEYALTCKERIDTLQLFSPAFFQDKDAKFKKLQTLSFAKNSDLYTQNFMQSITYPSKFEMQNYLQKGTLEELGMLLHYEWNKEKLQMLREKNITIEVYLGERDVIINALHVKDFFVPFSTVYYFKHVGHILK